MKQLKKLFIITSFLFLISVQICRSRTITAAETAQTDLSFTENGLNYTVIEAAGSNTPGEVTVTGYTEQGSAYLIIPGSTTCAGRTYTVTGIGENAFNSCKSLEKITVPDKVTSIGKQAFKDCSGLSDVTLPAGITDIAPDAFENTAAEAKQSGNLLIISGILLHANNLNSNVDIPDTVKCIANGAFKDNYSLNGVIIPESVTVIGSEAFRSCKSLKVANLPNSLTVLSEGAFADCTSLTTIVIPKQITQIADRVFYNCTNLSYITFPDTLTAFGASSFEKCSSLTELKFPKNMLSIGRNAFSECNGLKQLSIPSNILLVGESAFYACQNLTDVIVSSATIGRNAFGSCPSLKTVIMGNSVLNAGSSAFKNCTMLTDVFISNKITCIEYQMFAGCSSLRTVLIPGSVEYILKEAFLNCTGLIKISLPERCCYVDENAFTGCVNFRKSVAQSTDYSVLIDNIDSDAKEAEVTANAVQSGNTVYYLSGSSGNLANSSFDLYKQSSDSMNIIKIGAMPGCSYFILYKNYFYYLDSKNTLCRLSDSGDRSEELVSKVSELLGVIKDNLYYVKSNTVYGLNLKDMKPKKIVKLSTDPKLRTSPELHQYQIYNDRLYFITSDNASSFNIESINLSNQGRRVILKNVTFKKLSEEIYAAKDKVYYVAEDGSINSTDIFGNVTVLTKGSISMVRNDELFYTDDSGLYKIDSSGSVMQILPAKYIPEGCELTDISEDGRWLSYRHSGEDDSETGYLYVVNPINYNTLIISDADTIGTAKLIGNYIYYYKDIDYENGPLYYVRSRFR